jgi:hypothetical protein
MSGKISSKLKAGTFLLVEIEPVVSDLVLRLALVVILLCS